MTNDQVTRRSLLKGAGGAASLVALQPLATRASSTRSAGVSKRNNQDKGTIIFWMFGGFEGEPDFRRQQCAEFEQATGYKVDFQVRAWENQRQDILAALTGGDMPDIMNLHHKYVGEFGGSGDFQSLDGLPGFDEVAQRFVPSYLDALMHDGKHYGLPTYVLPFILVANQVMFDAAGVEIPTDWEEFKQVAAALSKPGEGVYGYTMPGGVNLDAAYRWVTWLYKGGGRVLSDDWTEPVFNDEAGVGALQMLIDLQQAGAIPPGNAAYASQESNDLWGTGKAAMATEGPWWPGVLTGQYKNFDINDLTIASMPAQNPPAGSNAPGTLIDLVMLSIMSRGKNVDGAWELLKFVRTAEADIAMAQAVGSLPTTAAAYDADAEWDVPGRDIYTKESQSAITWPNQPNITEIQMAIAQGVNAAFAGTVSPQDALDSAADEVRDILEG